MTYQQKPRKTQRGTFWRHLFSVMIAGGISKTVVAPLERLKLLMQVAPLLRLEPNQRFASYGQAFHRIYIYQGWTAFWRGNWANLFRVLPNATFRFAVYDKFKQYTSGEHHFVGRLTAGTATGMFSLLFHYPFDVVRVRMACDMTQFNTTRQYRGVLDCLLKMAQQEGVKGLYKGYLIANLGVAPYLGLSFATYDTLVNLYPQEQETISQVGRVVKVFGIGTLSGMAASFLTFPLDTVRRRMQMNGGIGVTKNYLSTMDCFQKMWAKEGLLGFYKGCGLSLLKIIPAVTVQFTVYDYMKEFIFE